MASNNENKDSLKESVLMNLRSVTQSLKGGVPLNCLERDYRDLLGNSIPYRELGYTSLQSFLKDIPHVISLKNKDGQLVAEGVADSSTAHIVSLVNRQKTAKPMLKPSRRSHAVNRRGYASRYSARSSKAVSPKFPQRDYTKSSHPSYQNKKHSKQPRTIPRSESPKPPEPKVQEVSSRNYEVAPRFLRLHSKKRNQRELEQKSTFEHIESSENFDNECNSNNHISSPRPLLNSRSSAVKSTQLKELESAASPKEYVEIYARINNLSVKYTTKPCGQKKDTKGFISKLDLGEKKYNGYFYCSEAKTVQEAEKYAALAAIEDIKKNKEHLASCRETPIHSAEDVQKLISRIEEIVLEKPSGMFTNGICNEYENKYNELLPENWLDLLQQSHTLEIDHLDVPYGRIPEGVNYIVRPARFSSGSTTPSSVSELEKADNSLEDSVSRMIVRKDQLPTIPELMIPFGNEWPVYIVDISKTIAARLIDYDNEFLNMSEEMKSFYKKEYLPAVEVSEGLLYATCDSDSDVFHRVLVQKIKDTDWVECYFVDEGLFAEVPKSNLQELNTDFWKLPYQAIHMSLDGLDEYEPYMSSDDLKYLLGNTYVALVKRWTTTISDFFPDDPAVHKIIYSVVLYNTDGTEDVNMNDIIKNTVLESLAAKLPKLSTSSRAYLTHVKSTGEIFLRFLTPHESWLEIELEKLYALFEEGCLHTTIIYGTKIYASKYNGKWYRTVPTQNSSTKDPLMYEMLFIDYGFTHLLPVKQVCELEPYSDFLSSLKPQAIECVLFNPFPSPDSKWTPAAISELMRLAPVNEELIVRVINEGDANNLPKVNLHKRTYQNGDSFIISINESLAFKAELFDTSSSNAVNLLPQNSSLKLSIQNTIRPPMPRTTLSNFSNANSFDESNSVSIKPPSPANECVKWATTPDNIKSPDALEYHDPPPLKLPEVPEVGQQFDIFVTMAAHPHCFYVQPYKTMSAMNELMNQMNQFYSLEENLIEMPPSLLKINSFYAVKHSDNFWYRARLQSIINNDPLTVVVSYVDFGDLVTVNMHQLQRLYEEFRLLPCQGIKAALAGVRPVDKDWKPMDCVQFQDMVKERKFVSIIQKKHLKDNHEFSTLELELIVIDVSDPKEDIYIHELLIEKGMACSVQN